ncbi:MAG: T9SS type A sorting domain-containing protein [Sphingomonadales bacterium]
MRIIAVLFCVVAGLAGLQAQSAERELLSATGGSFSGSFSADWSLGNLVGETGGSGNALLTQGFQQAVIVQSTNSLQSVLNSPIRLMPNPSRGDAVMQWNNMSKDASVTVYNMAGARVYEAVWPAGQSVSLPGKNWIPGVYQMAVLCEGKNHLLKYVRL